MSNPGFNFEVLERITNRYGIEGVRGQGPLSIVRAIQPFTDADRLARTRRMYAVTVSIASQFTYALAWTVPAEERWKLISIWCGLSTGDWEVDAVGVRSELDSIEVQLGKFAWSAHNDASQLFGQDIWCEATDTIHLWPSVVVSGGNCLTRILVEVEPAY